MYLIDADWAISFLNGRTNAVGLVETLANDGIALSVITYGELYEGLLTREDGQGRLTELDRFTAMLDVLSPALETARHYAAIRSRLRSQGMLIPDNDLWLAAAALTYDLTIVSRDVHFDRITEVKRYRGT